MDRLPTPTQTPNAHRWLHPPDTRLDRVQRALLSTIDGPRNIVELESFARALGLSPDSLELLHRHGLIEFASAHNRQTR